MARSKAGKAAHAIIRPGKFMQAKADEEAAKEQLKNANRMRAEGFDLVNRLDWEPDYVSDLMPSYKKAESPVARSYLESLLTGTNPSSVQGTRLGADRLKAGAQAGFDQQFGGWDQLLARQRELEQETPWAPGKFAAPAVYKLPSPQGPQEPPYMAAARADPGGHTPEGNAALQQAWGIDDDYWKRLEEATGRPVPRTVGRG